MYYFNISINMRGLQVQPSRPVASAGDVKLLV